MKPGIDPTLLATLELHLAPLDLAQTLEASPTATIKPAGRPSVAARGLPDPALLPRISLGGGGVGTLPRPDGSLATHDLALGALLGEGGMGRVHAAFQHSLEREVAVKTLRDGAGPPQAIALFREAVLTGTLEHPGIVPVHALGVDETGLPILVMKRIEGVQWATLIAQPDHSAWASRPGHRLVAHVEILMQVCRTVQFAHTRGILHRDIKPENVMLGEFGEVYLVDWGIALRLDQVGASLVGNLAGTPAYIAPEMITGHGVDARSDVYLLGATLHEAVTGETRNRGTSIGAVLASALAVEPYAYAPSVPAELAEICNRATARSPEDRFESAEALRRALAVHLRHHGAITLIEEARARTAELVELLERATKTKEDSPPSDLALAYRLANEARFGYSQALREWADSEDAQRGLDEQMALVVDLELRQGHLDAAEVLMRDLKSPSAALLAHLERARRERDRRAAEQARLHALAQDQDVTLGARARAFGVGVFVLSIAGASIFLFVTEKDFSQTRPERMLQVALVLMAITVLSLLPLHKKLLASGFNRRTTALTLVAMVGVVVSRLAATVQHLSYAQMVVQDLLVISIATGAIAVTLLRWMWVLAAVSLLGVVVSMVSPNRAPLMLTIVMTTVPLITVFALARRRSEQTERS